MQFKPELSISDNCFAKLNNHSHTVELQDNEKTVFTVKLRVRVKRQISALLSNTKHTQTRTLFNGVQVVHA